MRLLQEKIEKKNQKEKDNVKYTGKKFRNVL